MSNNNLTQEKYDDLDYFLTESSPTRYCYFGEMLQQDPVLAALWAQMNGAEKAFYEYVKNKKVK